MIKVSKTIKKQEALILKLSDVLDDIYYLGIDKDEALVKIKYNIKLDPLFKNNEEDVETILCFLKEILYKISEIK